MDGACGDNAEDGGEDERNEEEKGAEWSKEDGEEEEKEEERRKDEDPTEEGRKVVTITYSTFQPISDKLSDCRAQPVATILQGCNDSSSKKTATLCCFFRDCLCLDDSEEQDNAEWEYDKPGDNNDISEGDGEDEDQVGEGIETKFARIAEEVKDVCKVWRISFDTFPSHGDDNTIGHNASTFLQKYSEYFRQIIYNTHLFSFIFNNSCFSFQVNLHRFPHSKGLVPPDCKGRCI